MKECVKLSVVVSAHNEQQYLPYLLSSLTSCKVHEAIFVLDRCTDQSKTIIEHAKLPFEKRIIELKEKKWHSMTAEPMAIGFKASKGDMIFALNSDFYLDHETFNKHFNGFDFVSFGLRDYPLFESPLSKLKTNVRNIFLLYEKLRCFSLRKPFATGLYGISRNAYNSVPHCDRSDEDYYILMSLTRKGFLFKFFNGRSLHLRPSNERSARMRGERTALYHVGLLHAIWLTYRELNKTFFKAYLTTRFYQKAKGGKV